MAGLVQLLGLAAAPLAVSAHANIVWPYTWFDKGGNIGNNHNQSLNTHTEGDTYYQDIIA